MNIILLISDTFRYDNLFERAAMPVRTPHLDSFAARAVSMTQFYTGSFPTIPHRTDLISGRTGWPWYGWQDLSASTANALPRLLGDHGYVSQLICDCPHLFNSGFQKTFDAAVALRGQEGDMPMLRTSTLIAVADALPQHAVVYAQHQGRRGHPVGFSAELYSELVQLTGDEGARRVVARFPSFGVEVDDPGVLIDLDTTDDLAALLARLSATTGEPRRAAS